MDFSTKSFGALTAVMDVTPLDLEIRKKTGSYWLRKNEPDKARDILGTEATTKREIHTSIDNVWQAYEKGEIVGRLFPTTEESREGGI